VGIDVDGILRIFELIDKSFIFTIKSFVVLLIGEYNLERGRE
jgi:hypothetical protein